MKKKILIIIIVLLLLAVIVFLLSKIVFKEKTILGSKQEELPVDKNTVTYNGWLHTDGAQLKNEKNELIQLRGVSSHGIEWFPDCVKYEEMEILKKDWNINVVRIAMYTDAGNTGFVHNPDFNMNKVCEIVDNAIDEASNGYANKVIVKLYSDGSASVEDNGRGVPVARHRFLSR